MLLKTDDGDIKLQSEDHNILLNFNRIVTPESEDEKNRNKMISDVMRTPRKKSIIGYYGMILV